MRKRPSPLERRRQILEAARVVFVRKGFAGTRMIEVATRAKVGKGTLYEYFRSKEELLSTLLVGAVREALDTLAAQTSGEEPERALAHTIDYLIRVALEEQVELYGLFFDFWGLSPTARLATQRELRDCAQTFRSVLGDLVRRGQSQGKFRADLDPELLARALLAVVDGMGLQLVILGDPVNAKRFAASLKDLVLRGVRSEGALGGASLIREEARG